ncbi:MAG: FAD:protein FMN transferase [Lentisphaerae bacterium]|nr:FAD:protein FMN transferase [Lentisphaerota bacterium]
MKHTIAFLVLFPVALCGCAPRGEIARREGLAMGTFFSVAVPGAGRRALARHMETVSRRLGALEAELSVYDENSAIARLNRAAPGCPVPVSPAAADVLALARRYAVYSGGAFDPTVAPLLRVWGFRGGPAPTAAPPAEALAEARAAVGYRGLVVTNGMAMLTARGAGVDLGGIAKGYAVDRAYDALRGEGAAAFLVDLGGNIRCAGRPAPGRPWRIGVRDPFRTERLLGTLTLPDGMAVATSGHYERFVTLDGERYAHILDPRTGRPVRGMASVTVLAPTAAEADALSTALFVMGPRGGRALMRSRPDAHVLFVPDARPLRLLADPGFLQYFACDAGVTVLSLPHGPDNG